MSQDRITGEADQVHNQMARTALTMQQQQQSANPWTQAWADRPTQPQVAPPPRPVQPTAQPAPVPVKPALARRQAQPSLSSMSGAPANPPFPAQMGADPWARARERQQ